MAWDSELLEPFWAAIAEGEIALPRCPRCREWQWYPTLEGPICCGGAYEWIRVGGTGTVFSFTRVHRRFVEAVDPPYTVGLVEPSGLPGIRIVGRLAGDDVAWRIGTEVRVDPRGSQQLPRPVFSALGEGGPDA